MSLVTISMILGLNIQYLGTPITNNNYCDIFIYPSVKYYPSLDLLIKAFAAANDLSNYKADQNMFFSVVLIDLSVNLLI